MSEKEFNESLHFVLNQYTKETHQLIVDVILSFLIVEEAERDVRVAVIGNVDSGKSTLIGVLTSGELDDGRGKCRKKILRHNHEQTSGRTSSLSQHLMGFKEQSPVHNPVPMSAPPSKKTTAYTKLCDQSDQLVTFVDLAGHEKYLKTTITGLTGTYPDYALIVVGANMGVSKMTKEHIQVAAALKMPMFVVVTKIDICPKQIVEETMQAITKTAKKRANRRMFNVTTQKHLDVCFESDPFLEKKLCPLFKISSVTGFGLDLLNQFLSRLKPRKSWQHRSKYVSQGVNELEIDGTFAVRGVGLVISGVQTIGRFKDNEKAFLGPFGDESFKQVLLKSIHQKRFPKGFCNEGDTASIAIRFLNKKKEIVDRSMIRKGMVVTSKIPEPVWKFRAKLQVLHHPTTIKEGYQPVVHCGSLERSVEFLKIHGEQNFLRSGDVALVDLRFVHRPEFLHAGRRIILREGLAKCSGKIQKIYDWKPEDEKETKKKG